MSRMMPVDSVRKAEAGAVAAGTAEFDLMLSAGRQAADIIQHHYPHAIRFLFFCGGGNNGGGASLHPIPREGKLHPGVGKGWRPECLPTYYRLPFEHSSPLLGIRSHRRQIL